MPILSLLCITAEISALSSGIYASLSIIEAIIKLGNILGMETLAEGIETLEQSNLIKSLGVHYAQGYLFSKPLNVNSVEQTLYSLFESASLAWKFDDHLPWISR